MITERIVFEYDYVWVNRGEWRSGSDAGKAIDAALSAAYKESVETWSKAYAARSISLTNLPCPDNHIDLCAHIHVTFYEEVK